MPTLPLRMEFDAKSCRLAARHTGDATQIRRFLSIAAIYDGASRSEPGAASMISAD